MQELSMNSKFSSVFSFPRLIESQEFVRQKQEEWRKAAPIKTGTKKADGLVNKYSSFNRPNIHLKYEESYCFIKNEKKNVKLVGNTFPLCQGTLITPIWRNCMYYQVYLLDQNFHFHNRVT